jgi:hypothetical protein
MNLKRILKEFGCYQRNKKTEWRLSAGVFTGENEAVEYLDDIAEKYIIGQSIVDIKNESYGELVTFVLSNGFELRFHSNEGCGGCGNGWYTCPPSDLIDTRENGNVITRVAVQDPENAEYGTYSVFIYSLDKRIIQADFSGEDNGYYGVGIWAEVVIPEDVMAKLCS